MKYDLKLSTVIDDRSAGKTILQAIAERFSYHSEEFWRQSIAEGHITINQSTAKPNQILKSGDLLNFTIPDFEEQDIDSNYDIVWKNEYLWLVNKPAGLPVHSTRRFYYQTLIAAMRRREHCDKLNPLQRLDRETSGLMFLSDPDKVPHNFHKNFKKYILGKFYLAIVRGDFPWSEKTVSEPLAELKTPPVRYRMHVTPNGKSAETVFIKLFSAKDSSLLLVRLITGRKHQIRAHLEYLGYPLIGEKLYYRNAEFFLKRCEDNLLAEDLAKLGSSNHLLHAYAIRTYFPGMPERIFYADRVSDEFSGKANEFGDWRTTAISTINSLCKKSKNDLP
ncbi:MAG: hypothetical protein Kow0029_04040 [Candidatus Rifleibacteriota bacterium]